MSDRLLTDDLIRHARDKGETTEIGMDLIAAAEVIRSLTRELAEARDRALEEAAKVVDEAERNWTKIESKTVYEERYAASTAADASRDIAAALRALKEKP